MYIESRVIERAKCIVNIKFIANILTTEVVGFLGY